MAEIFFFPTCEGSDQGMERYLTTQECLALGLADPFESWTEHLEAWLSTNPHAGNQRYQIVCSLLADTWLVFHLACDQTGQLVMQRHHRLRWTQLQYSKLSDLELLVIVKDNLSKLRSALRDINQLHQPQVGMTLHDLDKGIDQLNQQLNNIFDYGGCTEGQLEWTA
ncbi:hypothetical protein [Kushneria indalinina]|uniref:Uncharacterized protein n=1 Tax=Kushneria indalinina DSM 14324 TaxID=1122140 RepID=A0A3D9DRS0_9GAMM|nr:hypothetical protein [Kushneria indalinina]REC93402.1 hypothetical protein C8D72_3448 [Kushneria indalinina DSM 14324]